MAIEFVSEIGDRLSEGLSNTEGAHVKTISAEYYKRTENGVVTNELIQEAFDSISPKVKYKKTVIQHTITVDDVTQEKCPFENPILLPTDYGNKTVAMINLYGTIMTSDTSAVTNSYIVWLDNDTSHSMGAETLSTNFITTDNYQVNFVANIQIPFSTGTMHPDGLYLDIWRHGLPAGSTVSVTAEVTILDRE